MALTALTASRRLLYPHSRQLSRLLLPSGASFATRCKVAPFAAATGLTGRRLFSSEAETEPVRVATKPRSMDETLTKAEGSVPTTKQQQKRSATQRHIQGIRDHLNRKNAETALQAFEEMSAEGLHSREGYICLLEAYALQQDEVGLAALPTKMKDAGIKPDLKTFQQVAQNLRSGECARSGKVWELLQTMDSMGVAPDTTVMNFLLLPCGKSRDIKNVDRIVQECNKRDIRPNLSTLSRHVSAYVDCTDCDKAFQVLQKMEEQRLYPLPIVYRRLLNLGVRRRNLDVAVHCFKALNNYKMQGQTMAIEPVYDTTLKFLCDMARREGQFDDMASVAKVLQDRGVQLHEVPNNKLLQYHAQQGDLGHMFRVLVHMQQVDPPQPVREWSRRAIVEACSLSSEHVDQAYYTIVKLKQQDALSHICCLNFIIQACAKLGDVDRAFATFVEVERSFDLTPNVQTFNGLIAVCLRANQGPSALRVMDEVEKRQLTPNEQTWSLLLRIHLRENNLPKAVKIYEQMTADDLVPTGEAYVSLMKKAEGQKDHGMIVHFFEEMKAHNIFQSASIKTMAEQARQANAASKDMTGDTTK